MFRSVVIGSSVADSQYYSLKSEFVPRELFRSVDFRNYCLIRLVLSIGPLSTKSGHAIAVYRHLGNSFLVDANNGVWTGGWYNIVSLFEEIWETHYEPYCKFENAELIHFSRPVV
ncbi:MAG: hypothetical protein ON057_001991 [Glomeribacter sp. 1016415]|nr:hypothetical protein [Glomeribacter sp. 1016415]